MMTRGLWISSGFAAIISSLKVTQPQQTGINQSKTHWSRLLWNLPVNDSQCYPQLTHLFLLNCTAKPDMGCMALLVNVSSINICPLLRANVPLISKPLPFAAGSHTCNNNSGHFCNNNTSTHFYGTLSQVATPAITTTVVISAAPYFR